jgi:hypothetical protein
MPGAPTSAVLPLADSATEEPNRDAPEFVSGGACPVNWAEAGCEMQISVPIAKSAAMTFGLHGNQLG